MSAVRWLVKFGAAAAIVLIACGFATVRFGSGLQMPATTTRDGTLITLSRYLREPVPDIALVGSSGKKIEGLLESHPRRVNTRYGLVPVTTRPAATTTTAAATTATSTWLLWARFVDGQRATTQLSAVQRGDRRLRF